MRERRMGLNVKIFLAHPNETQAQVLAARMRTSVSEPSSSMFRSMDGMVQAELNEEIEPSF